MPKLWSGQRSGITIVVLLALLFGCTRTAPHAPPAQARARRCVLVSIDGLIPESYLSPDAHGLRVPTLRRFVQHGAHSDGALSVYPSVTYPAHTSIATGVTPARHGIHGNRTFDPLDKNLGGWHWYAEELRSAPIWQVAEAAGQRTALIGWPASVGARVSWLVPEYWRAHNEDDGKLLRALSTPGLLDEVARNYPGFWQRFPPPHLRDEGATDVAHHLLERAEPALLLMHIFQVDGAQHHFGLWSPEAIAAIEHADQQLGRLLAIIDRQAGRIDTLLMVVSDHGFMNVERKVQPGAVLREAGLVSVDAEGKPIDWKAAVLANSGTAYVYLRNPADGVTAAAVHKLFLDKHGTAGSGIGRVYGQAEIAELGGDPAALLALEAEPGVTFGEGYRDYEVSPNIAAVHGYDPRRSEMKASLLWLAPGVRPGPRQGGRLIDVAPTIARWLGLQLPQVDGSALD